MCVISADDTLSPHRCPTIPSPNGTPWHQGQALIDQLAAEAPGNPVGKNPCDPMGLKAPRGFCFVFPWCSNRESSNPSTVAFPPPHPFQAMLSCRRA